MSQEGEEAEIAASALTKLENMHDEFVKYVQSLAIKKVNAGELDTDGKHLLVTCLGVHIRASHRPIVRDGRLSALEYPFLVAHRDQELLIWRMFLEADYSLYSGLDRQGPICSSTNLYLARYLITPLASALLRSPIFAPLQ